MYWTRVEIVCEREDRSIFIIHKNIYSNYMKQRQFIIKSKENYRYKVVYGIKLKKTKKKKKKYM